MGTKPNLAGRLILQENPICALLRDCFHDTIACVESLSNAIRKKFSKRRWKLEMQKPCVSGIRMARPVKNKNVSLQKGRPPLKTALSKIANPGPGQSNTINPRRKSSKATRTLISTHHRLQKARAAAVTAGDETLVREIDGQIQQLGGLEAYQAASLTGQDRDRGGDSSEKLVDWLRGYGLVGSKAAKDSPHQLRVLEIGALSSKNAISSMIGKGIESVKRIDLHSQEPDHIEEIDFMDFAVPRSDQEKYDILSLSLVLNYVPDISLRGDMLRHTTEFLSILHGEEGEEGDSREKLPCLFVVLPLPCLNNSRYMTHDHFVGIMASLGYILIEHHDSQKLSYMLFTWTGPAEATMGRIIEYKKIEINPGKTRNNFAVVLAAGPD